MNIGRSAFLSRLFVYGLLLGTLPTVIIGVLSFLKASDTIQDSVNQANQLVVNHIESTIEQMMQSAESSVLMSWDTVQMGEMLGREWQNTYNDYIDFGNVQQTLNRIKSKDNTQNGVSLYSLEKGWLMKSNSGFVEPSEQDVRTKELLLKKVQGNHLNSFWTSDDKEITYVSQIPFFAAVPKGILAINISLSEIEKTITNNRKLGSLLILDDEGNVVYSQDGIPNNQDLSELPLLKQLESSAVLNGSLTTDFQGKKVGIVYRKSQYSHWTYLSIIDLKDITKDSRTIAWFTLFSVVGMLLVIIAFTWIGSKKIYNPISRLYQRVVASTEFAESGSNEVQKIGERFETLMDEQNYMKNQLKQFFVMKLLLGEVRPAEIREKVSHFGFREDWECLCVGVLQIDGFEHTPYLEKERDLLMFAINNIVSDLIPETDRLLPMLVNQSQVTLFGSKHQSSVKFKSDLYEWAAEIQKMVMKYLKLKVSFGFSRIYYDLKETNGAYREGLEILKYSDRLGEEIILFIDDVVPDKMQSFRYPSEIEDELLDAIQLLQPEHINTLLHQFVAAVFSFNMQHHEYKMFLLRLLLEINRILQQTGLSLQEVYGGDSFAMEQLFYLRTTTDIENWFLNSVILPSMKRMEDQMKTRHLTISEEIKRMVRHEFDTDLTLEVCASRLNYNPNYLGYVFRKEAGVAFSDYLSEYRLNMAKEWLRDTDMKISNIAERLGYYSSANFIRYFRKSLGVTPGQYRKKYHSG